MSKFVRHRRPLQLQRNPVQQVHCLVARVVKRLQVLPRQTPGENSSAQSRRAAARSFSAPAPSDPNPSTAACLGSSCAGGAKRRSLPINWRLTWLRLGKPVSLLAKSRISSTEAKNSFASSGVTRISVRCFARISRAMSPRLRPSAVCAATCSGATARQYASAHTRKKRKPFNLKCFDICKFT